VGTTACEMDWSIDIEYVPVTLVQTFFVFTLQQSLDWTCLVTHKRIATLIHYGWWWWTYWACCVAFGTGLGVWHRAWCWVLVCAWHGMLSLMMKFGHGANENADFDDMGAQEIQ
jgi:hypothetical protein